MKSKRISQFKKKVSSVEHGTSMSKSKFMNFSKIQLNFPGIHEFFLRNYSRTHTERIVWNDKVYRLDYTQKAEIQSNRVHRHSHLLKML